jgi:hypothetical protein
LESSSSPTLLITLTGPWLCVYGAVWTTEPIIQRLTDMIWLGKPPCRNEYKVNRIACTLLAAKEAIKQLEHFYQNMKLCSPVGNDRHSRFFPFLSAYPDPRCPGKCIKFEYVEPMEREALRFCVTYRARTTTPKVSVTNDANQDHFPQPRDIVVKFVRKYGEEAHCLLASHGMAPQLLYRGPLSPNSELSMIVMDYFPGKTLSSVFGSMEVCDETYKGVKKALDVLHEAGFVYGDLRRPNVLVQGDNTHVFGEGLQSGTKLKVVLIDFDWADKVGIARYPAFLNPRVMYPKDVGPWRQIRKEHDDLMLENLRRPVDW